MFWRFGGYANISTLDTVLDKPDVTVEDLLDESDLIQELKQQNGKLIEFLRDEPVLKKLLNYVVTDQVTAAEDSKYKSASPKPEEKEERPSGISFFGRASARSRSKSQSKKDSDGETEQERKEAQRKKYAYVSCEVLSSEVWSLTEAVLDQQDALREFWQYMHRPAPLDPLQAGYFTKVNEALLDKKTEEMLAFFKSLDGIVSAMLQHVDCPMVMDLLLKIISLEKHEGGAGIVDWLQSKDLIPLLLGYLSADHSSATQTSAGDFLKAIITISANATTQDQSVIGPNELTRQLVSEECIQTLITDMLRGGNPLTVGVGIIIEVIRKNNSDYDLDNQAGPEPKTTDPIYLGTLLRQFAAHVPDFMNLVRSPSAKKPDLKAAFGGKIEPLGFDRFKTCELMAELLHCSNMGLLNERGAEEEVRKRDKERGRLKAEGKLATPKAPTSPSQENSHEEFGSSVDSHGFHHAKRPSDENMSDDDETGEEARKLEVQNTSDEDGFEKVSAPSTDDFPVEVSFDVEDDEKTGDDSTKHDSAIAVSPTKSDAPKPLSPLKANLHFDPPPTRAADSPTTAGVTDRIHKLDVDEDTVMTEFGEEKSDSDEDGPSELEKELAKADTPAPLFARKDPPAPLNLEHTDEPKDIDASVTTIQGDESVLSNGERAPYDTEADGNAVVGDLLKIQFVEHQVVPTILDFFFRFPWNNFLHNVVYDVVQQVFNGTLERGYNRTLAFDLFTPASLSSTDSTEPKPELNLTSTKDIVDRILDGQRASDQSQQKRGMRLGYMGHLTLIAEEVCKFGNRTPLEQAVLDQVNREEWIEYVEGTLAETRDKDNAVLGGARPQDSIGSRPMGIGSGGGGGGFTTASGLTSAGIGGGLDGGSQTQGFEINSGTMVSSFPDNEEDEEMLEEEISGKKAVEEDEQPSTSTSDSNTTPSIPPPLNIPPSRARRQLAARLAAKKAEAATTTDNDPDAADNIAVEAAAQLPEDPGEGIVTLGTEGTLAADTLGEAFGLPSPEQREGLEVTGLRGIKGLSQGASRFSGLFEGSDDDSSSSSPEDELDEDDAGRDLADQGYHEDTTSSTAMPTRRPFLRRESTREAKERTPLDDEEDDEDLGPEVDAKLVLNRGAGEGGSGGSDSSEEEELVEIRPRRTS